MRIDKAFLLSPYGCELQLLALAALSRWLRNIRLSTHRVAKVKQYCSAYSLGFIAIKLHRHASILAKLSRVSHEPTEE